MWHLKFHIESRICKCEVAEYGWEIKSRVNPTLILFCLKCKNKVEQEALAGFIETFKVKSKFDPNQPLSEKERILLDAMLSEVTSKLEKSFDDGFYWINLMNGECNYEARMMNHCGKTSAGVVWSLRDRYKKPHVTITVKRDRIINISGKRNELPDSKYRKYIQALFDHKIIKDAVDKGEQQLKEMGVVWPKDQEA
jgi:hypothetical protein